MTRIYEPSICPAMDDDTRRRLLLARPRPRPTRPRHGPTLDAAPGRRTGWPRAEPTPGRRCRSCDPPHVWGDLEARSAPRFGSHGLLYRNVDAIGVTLYEGSYQRPGE